MPMRAIVTAMALVVCSTGAQAQVAQPAPPMRLPGIVDRMPPGSIPVPCLIDVRMVPGDRAVDHDLREARETIERRRNNGELTRREARRLRREARLIASLSHRYARDGLSDDERGELALRAQVLRSRSAAPRLGPR
jgi:hypothetical protein